MSQTTNEVRRTKNRERQRRFWASKTPEEKRRLRLRYALNVCLKMQQKGGENK